MRPIITIGAVVLFLALPAKGQVAGTVMMNHAPSANGLTGPYELKDIPICPDAIKFDGTSFSCASGGGGAVSSVFGRTGAVVATDGDYSWNQIASKPATFPPQSHTHVKTDITDFGTYEAPLTFDAPLSRATNMISIPAATTFLSGYLTSTDWNTFNGKQPALGFTPENSANKNAANGYAGLDASSKLNASQIPNNSANTTGTAAALAGTPTLCTTGQAPTGILANGNATGCAPIGGGGSSVALLTADSAGSTNNNLTSTGMNFSMAVSTTYTLDCQILFTVSTTAGVGLTLGVSGPGTPTQVTLMRYMNTTATAFRLDSSAGASWGAKIGTTATTVTSLSSARLTGSIENGAAAGTLTIQFANIGTTGTTVVKRGSFCRLQ